VVPGLIGVFVAGLGAMFAFAAQMSMGTSWRGGVAGGAAGNAVDRARHGAVTDFVDLYRGDRRRCDAGSGIFMIGPCPASSPPQAGLP
jgi:lipoprotein signal peptidase